MGHSISASPQIYPLFVDPFLLFNSDKADYQELHREILRYLGFLRDKALPDLEEGLDR
jgi:hypothetical protein